MSNHADIVVVVGQISSRRSDVDTVQVNVEVVSVLRLIDYWNGDGSVLVDPGGDRDLLDTAQGIDADSAWTGEAEVRSECPEAGRDEIVVVLQTDQCVVSSGVLCAPPVEIAGRVADGESIVHVQSPLKALATIILVRVEQYHIVQLTQDLQLHPSMRSMHQFPVSNQQGQIIPPARRTSAHSVMRLGLPVTGNC